VIQEEMEKCGGALELQELRFLSYRGMLFWVGTIAKMTMGVEISCVVCRVATYLFAKKLPTCG
jgi:hypothetical protein